MQSQNEYYSHCKRNIWFVFCNEDGSNSVRRKEKKLILNIYQYFDSERKRGHPFYSLDKVADRTIQTLGVRNENPSKIKHCPMNTPTRKSNIAKFMMNLCDVSPVLRIFLETIMTIILLTQIRMAAIAILSM